MKENTPTTETVVKGLLQTGINLYFGGVPSIEEFGVKVVSWTTNILHDQIKKGGVNIPDSTEKQTEKMKNDLKEIKGNNPVPKNEQVKSNDEVPENGNKPGF